jgi:transposase
MTRQCRNFDPSFKLEVVRMITEQGLSISHVSQTWILALPQSVAGWNSTRPSNKASQALANR